jgi:hypothetical protein
VSPIRVKTKRISNLYVLVVYSPGDRTQVAARFTARRPWAPFTVGEALRVGRTRVRIIEIIRTVQQRNDVVQHVCEIFTRAILKRRTRSAKNVVAMPAGDQSVIAQFIRYHVLVRVFDGNPDAWLAHIRARGGGDQADLRFVRWVRSRLRQDPALLTAIRRMVDATPFWRAAGA